ncbi:unnamed protein product, partial [Rotaria magnacalcarata]
THLGLVNDYLRNETVRDQCRQLMALSLIPIDEVKSQFQRLKSIMSASLDDLFVYFKIPWVAGVVPIKMWSFHNVDHRTNNTSEGENTIVLNLNNSYSLPSIYIQAYNLRFATRLSRKHPNISSFIQLI